MVDYVTQATYAEIELDDDPIVIPSCGHIMTLSSMDGHMDMKKFYKISEDFLTRSSVIVALQAPAEPFSADNLRSCPLCRRPLRDVNRYSRIVRQGLIDETTKKFIMWANQQYVPLEARLFDEESRLSSTAESDGVNLRRLLADHDKNHPNNDVLALHGSAARQFDKVRGLPVLTDRYQVAFKLKLDILRFLAQVREEEQPFGRIFDMVRDIRRRRGIDANLVVDRSVLNTRFRMLTTLLMIRVDFAVLADYLGLRKQQQQHLAHFR